MRSVDVRDKAVRRAVEDTDAQAAAYIECALPDGRIVWGVGMDEDVASASVRAILSAANSAARESVV